MIRHGGPESPTGECAAPGSAETLDFAQILSIADALPMGLAYIGTDRRYRFVNQALADFLDRSRGDILGKTMDEVLGEVAMAARLSVVEAALAGERNWLAAVFPHPTRGDLFVQSDYLPQVDGEGKVTGVIIIVNDVTEQRAASSAIRESEDRFRRIADHAPVMMWVSRADRSRDFVNQAYVEFFGGGVDHCLAADWYDLVHPDDRQRMIDETAAAIPGREPIVLEGRFRRHDGEWRWLRSVSTPRYGPDGVLAGYIGAASDNNVAKEAERELRAQVNERTRELAESEARVRGLFDSALEMISLLTLDGRYIEVNRSACETLGLDPDSVRGLHPWEIGPFNEHPESRKRLRALVARAAAGETVIEEMAIDTIEGTASLLVSMKPVPDSNGNPLFLVGEGRDISELKATQDQLRQAQKMEALGQLTGGIAHDFNNLLTVVVGGLDMISRQLEDGRLKRYADNALKAAERGARLTSQLLAFSRVQRLEVQPTDVKERIEEMRPLLRNVLGPGIAKRFDLDPDPTPVMADPTQLEVAVLNLAINARDAMPDGGEISFVTHNCHMSDDPELDDGDYVELSIGDTGSGMPPDVLARAFEPFFTTKDVGKGTGLGLSMVYGMARQSGGTVRIESEEGVGTIVRLYFRHADEVVADLAAPHRATSAGQETQVFSILVVDDDEDVRRFIACSLEELGHDVVEAADGAAAIAEYDRARPDLVILDYLMPGMTGADVAVELRQRRADQPLLFVSGYSESEAIRDAAPDSTVLAKPFRPETLELAVRDAMIAR